MEPLNQPSRNYDSISPSAKALLLLKSHTNIPFARQAATLSMLPEHYEPDFTRREPGFWTRVVHFEVRYSSIDELLSDSRSKNIIELSSGFSFRGLALTRDRELNYVDTDLPHLIDTKKQYVEALSKDLPAPRGHLETRPLNALDEAGFMDIVDTLPEGEVTIVNEGLLMYLGMEEKETLCRIIRKVLQRRGGSWITADIYLKGRRRIAELEQGDTLKEFLEKHHVEDNMFESFDDATALFNRMGLTVDKEAAPDYSTMSAIGYLMASMTPGLLDKLREVGKVHATWRLRAAPSTPISGSSPD
jgi:O-methyltransferase involved in polyketide biosynthesis